MYVVVDKVTDEVLHVNPAPANQGLTDQEVYFRFDPETMRVGVSDGPLPEYFRVDETGTIVDLTTQEKVEAGVIKLEPDQTIRDGEIVEKTLAEKVEDALISIDPTQKIVVDELGERVVQKSLAEQFEEGILTISPAQKLVADEAGERIVDKSLTEMVEEGLLTLDPTQKIVDDEIQEKSTQELLDEGLLTKEEAKAMVIQRLRAEITAYFQEHRTPSGFRLDDLARQKASFSSQYRSLPADDPTKKPLLDAGLIYPDHIVDEILAEVSKVQAAYSAAKQAIVTAFDAGEPVANWEGISIRDYLAE